MAIRREPALGMGGYPAQEIYDNGKYLGKITRTSTYGFYWMAEDGKWDNGKCLKMRSSGSETTAEEAEKKLIRVFGITQEEFE